MRRIRQTYSSWTHMKQRCYNNNNDRWEQYGGRGIQVCSRWKRSFMMFLNDMGPRPEGTTLDRIDNDGHYEPGNCRWSTAKEQANNRDKIRINTPLLTHNNMTMTIREWSKHLNIKARTISDRYYKGWSTGKILSKKDYTTRG